MELPKEVMLERALKFDRIAKDLMEKRLRERRDISKMHDTAKRTMDETAKKLGL